MPNIKILIKGNGKIVVDAEGFIGADCIEATKKLEEILNKLGVNVKLVKRNLKPEYYQVGVKKTWGEVVEDPDPMP